MTPEPAPPTWVTIDTSPDGMAIRLVVLLLIAAVSIMLGLAFRDGVMAYLRGFRRAAIRALGKEPPPDWIVTDWLCGACLSINVRAATRCRSCRSGRVENEVKEPVGSAPADVIPGSIDGTGKRVALEHSRAAHRDPHQVHWRLRVDGRVMGSACLRDGALALLRAVHGADIVLFDQHDSGLVPYRLDDLISAFERPALPLNEPCPEALASY
jgi:hypothetical protein